MNQVWQKGNYKIYHSDDGYILHNASMDGFAHSHLKSFKMAVLIADLAEHKRIPHHLSRYLLISLIRVSNDSEYVRKVQDLLDNKSKKDYYYNANKGVRRK